MSLLDSLPTYTLALPILLLGGAWILSKILKFSMWSTLIVGCSPFVLPYLDLPFSKEFLDAHPIYLIAGGWALLFCFALGRSAVVPLLSDSGKSPGGVARAAYGVVLGTSLLVVALLVSKPDILESAVPGWKGSAGLVLLCASLLSMSLWLARVLKAAIVFSLWSVVSLVLASELLLNKLPHNVVREDLRQLEPLASRFGLEDTLKSIESFSLPGSEPESSVSEKIKAYFLGVSSNAGHLFPKDHRFSRTLERVLQRQGIDAEIKDGTDYSSSTVQLKEIALRQVAPTKPDLVFIMGWSGDSVRGRNSYGVPGLSELEARAYVEKVRTLHNYPFAADVVESVLYRYGATLFEPSADDASSESLPLRVAPSDYKTQLLETINVLQEKGAHVVLLPEPVVQGEDAGYREMMMQAAAEGKATFIPVDELLQQQSSPADGRLFARGSILSQAGYLRVANIISSVLAERFPTMIRPAVLGSSLPSQAELGTSAISIGTELTPIVRDEASFLVDPSQIRGDLIFRLKVAEQGTRFYRVVFSVNGEFVADRRLDSRDETRVRFSLPDSARKFSIVELSLKTIASPPPNDDLIGTTEFFVPTPVQVVSDPNGVSMIKVGRRAFFARAKAQGVVAVSIDLRSGDVINVLRSEDPAEVNRWILNQPWGNIVATSLQFTDAQALAALKPALKFIGAADAVISGGVNVAVLGITGVRKGTAQIESNKEAAASISLGSEILKSYSKFTLYDVRTGERESPKPVTPPVIDPTQQTN